MTSNNGKVPLWLNALRRSPSSESVSMAIKQLPDDFREFIESLNENRILVNRRLGIGRNFYGAGNILFVHQTGSSHSAAWKSGKPIPTDIMANSISAINPQGTRIQRNTRRGLIVQTHSVMKKAYTMIQKIQPCCTSWVKAGSRRPTSRSCTPMAGTKITE